MLHLIRISALISIIPCLTAITAGATEADDKAAANAAENASIRKSWDSWNVPLKPFRVIDNLYYVGPSGISSFLIVTPKGNILIDSGFDETVPLIRDSVTKLGFKTEDIKIILSSHAHTDHVGGHAAMKKLTGAKIMMSEADAAMLASGGTNDFTHYSSALMGYPPAHADKILRDGEKVSLGGTTLTCHLTPGHTKGCTTWTMDVTEDGQVHHVLFFGSTSILSGVPLINNTNYPAIATDLEHSYKTLKTLPCDVFLAPHAGFFDLTNKAALVEQGVKPNPFIDPAAYKIFLKGAEQKFQDQLAREKNEAAKNAVPKAKS